MARAFASVGGFVRYEYTPVGTYDEVFGMVVSADGTRSWGNVAFMAVDSETGEEEWVPSLPVSAFDPTGAGDCFGAAFIVGCLAGSAELEYYTKVSTIAGFDLADLITYPLSDDGSIGIIQDNTLFAVEPTRSFVNFGDNGIETKRKNSVFQYSLAGIEDFTLPGKVTDELGDVRTELCPGRNDRGSIRFAVWNPPFVLIGFAFGLGTNFCVRPYWLSPPYILPFESTLKVCTSR